MTESLQALSWQHFLNPKAVVILVLALVGMVTIWKGWLVPGIRWVFLVVAFVLFALPTIPGLGVPFEMHPSPMCATAKPLAFYLSRGAIPAGMLAIALLLLTLSVVGNKLFCSFACPLGAVQEMAARAGRAVLGRRRWPLLRPAFRFTGGVRALVLVVYLVLLFVSGIILYDWVNGFHFFHWTLALASFLPGFIFLLLSLVVWRPFCLLVCPLGLISWAAERVIPVKVHALADRCKDCGLCEKGFPCNAALHIRDGVTLGEDCFTCGICIDECPTDVFYFGLPPSEENDAPSQQA